MNRQGGPIRFLLGIAMLWCAARSVMLWPPSAASLPRLTYAPPLAAEPAEVVRGHQISVRLAASPALRIALDPPRPPGAVAMSIPVRGGMSTPQAAGLNLPISLAKPAPAGAVTPFQPASVVNRWSASSWAVFRSSGIDSLATGGLLGGSQAGLRIGYALDPGGDLTLAARISSPLSIARGREAAIGIDWRPIADLPLRFSVERRVGLDRGGRDAFAVGIAGGVGEVALPAGFRLDGYGQAGVVGARSRDAYVDGALRIERPLWSSGRTSVALGAGAWGAAQPGVARLDIGPQAVLRVPASGTTLRIGVDWRQRIAGDASPGSGPAISIGADF